MCKPINVFEQGDAVDKASVEVSAHAVSVGTREQISKSCGGRGKKVRKAEKNEARRNATQPKMNGAKATEDRRGFGIYLAAH